MIHFNYLFIRLLVIGIVSSGVFFACQSGFDSATPQQQSSQYSGEEIFRATFFVNGPAADRLETLKGSADKLRITFKANPKAENSYKEFTDEIIAQIKIIDPEFFDKFEKQIKSDNLYGIELAISNSKKMIRLAGYKSKYASFYKLADKIQEKKVDFSATEFKGLDVTKKEDLAKIKTVFKEQYSIDLDDEEYQVACTPVAGFCIAYAAALVVSVAGVVYTAAAAINVYAWVTVYAETQLWGGASNPNINSDALISDLATTF